MKAIREQLTKPLITGIIGLVVGLIVGLPILGWWLWPVEWKDAGPQHLQAGFKEIYLRMAMDSYAKNPDPVQAQQHIKEIGADAEKILGQIALKPGSQDPAIIKMFQGVALTGAFPKVTSVPTLAAVTPGATQLATQTAKAGAPTQKPATTTPKTEGNFLTKVFPYLCVIFLLVVIGIVAVFVLRGKVKLPRFPKKVTQPEQPQPAEFVPTSEEPPLAQFMTTYTPKSELDDDSFSIDSASGEFLGECGVGISETIGVGDPKRVAAFEVWLFDKNDIQTVTQVLMSQHAFADDITRQRLAAKGEPVFAEPGRELVLETATLRLHARVVDMSYGSGPLPPESFFERLTLQLSVWPKA